MDKKGFILYKGMYNPIKDLSNEQFGALMKAIFEYQENGTIPKLGKDIQMAFLFFKNQFDIDNKKYNNICLKRQEQGKKGGLAKATKSYQKLPKPSKATYKDKDKDKDKEIDLVVTEVTTLENYIKETFTLDFMKDIYSKFNMNKDEFKEECESFVMYWKEKNINGKKEKREKEKTFDPKLRFRTWMKNNDKWKKRILVDEGEVKRQRKLRELEEKKKALFTKI